MDFEQQEKWTAINLEYSLIWPVITSARPEDVPTDAAEWDNVPNKFEDHFDPAPGKGD
jgi:ferredoxin